MRRVVYYLVTFGGFGPAPPLTILVVWAAYVPIRCEAFSSSSIRLIRLCSGRVGENVGGSRYVQRGPYRRLRGTESRTITNIRAAIPTGPRLLKRESHGQHEPSAQSLKQGDITAWVPHLRFRWSWGIIQLPEGCASAPSLLNQEQKNCTREEFAAIITG